MQVQGRVPAPPKRSTFVSVLAWIYIVLMGLMTFAAIIEAIVFFTVLPPDAIGRLWAQATGGQQLPAVYQFMFSHMQALTLGGLVMSVFLLVASIGLLKRRNWARIIFIVFMGFSVVWNVASVFLMPSLYSTMPMVPQAQGLPVLKVIQTVMSVFAVVMALAFTVLFGWIVKKLLSARIKAEFGV
jgi:hypothetical protein